MSRFILMLLAAILFSVTTNILGQKPDNYGPYTMEWSVYEICKGPKQKNCGVFRMADKRNMSDILFMMYFSKDCPVEMARVAISSKQSGATKKLWHYSLDYPCQHFVMGPILMESFNLTSNYCIIKKGNYEVHLNMAEKSESFLGNNFFYGIYDFKVTAYNKNSNFFCVHYVLGIKKEPK